MYDYNCEESLTTRQLTLLVLSIVIPTDKDILMDIYNKKRELEIKDIHNDYQENPLGRGYLDDVYKEFQSMLRQIRCFYPGFIVYKYTTGPSVSELHIINVKPLTEQEVKPVSLYGKTSRGINIVNFIFNHFDISERFDKQQQYFKEVAEIIEKYGSFGIGEDDIYTSIKELSYDKGIITDIDKTIWYNLYFGPEL